MNRRRKRNNNIVRLKRYSVVHYIFFIIFIYLIVCIVKYVAKDHIDFYEVTRGTLTSNPSYTGIILRDELVVTSDYSGYLKCYLRSGDKVSANKAVYAVSESGESLSTARTSDETAITGNELVQLRSQLKNFSVNYDPNNYETVYSFKEQLEATLYEIEISDASNPAITNNNIVNIGFSRESGIVIYAADNYESLQPEQITEDIFKETNLQKFYSQGNNPLKKGDFVYKLIRGREWQVVFPVSQAEAQSYAEAGSVTIRLSDIDRERKASISVITGADDNKYAVITLNQYLESYANDRFLKFEIVQNRPTGLKIPKSAVTTKDFLVIPESYMTNNDNTTSVGFYTEDSNFITPVIRGRSSGYYFVDGQNVEAGMVVKHLKKKSEETYTIGKMEALSGVYNINKGYAVFEGVDILDENSEYYIVTGMSAYGLSAYDHIVLNATTINDDDMLYN